MPLKISPFFLRKFNAAQAHNLKVVGSNPTPATRNISNSNSQKPPKGGFLLCNTLGYGPCILT
jgi:hypothetical protein